ncbi:hypothetical protein, partial [Clostridium perfringens]
KFPLKPFSIKIDTQRGTFKQLFKFYPVRQVSKATAWCIGDEEELGNLLDPASGIVTALGAKARMGHGMVRSFSIVEDREALERWQQ